MVVIFEESLGIKLNDRKLDVKQQDEMQGYLQL